jgi:hypothetical protein
MRTYVARRPAQSLLAVAGDPFADISVLADVRLVAPNGWIAVDRLPDR